MRERLYRSRDDRMIFGVAGGMADWLDLDPAVVRLVWALLVFVGGTGLLLYIVAAIVIPEEPFDSPVMTPQYQPPAGADASAAAAGAGGTPGTSGTGAPGAAAYGYPQSRAERRAARRAARAAQGPSTAGIVFGLILVLVGGWFLLRDLVPALDDRLFGPAILIAVGVLLVFAAIRRNAPPA